MSYGPSERHDLATVGYNLFGWWFIDGLKFVLGLLPLLVGILIALVGLFFFLSLSYVKETWSGKDEGQRWGP